MQVQRETEIRREGDRRRDDGKEEGRPASLCFIQALASCDENCRIVTCFAQRLSPGHLQPGHIAPSLSPAEASVRNPKPTRWLGAIGHKNML